MTGSGDEYCNGLRKQLLYLKKNLSNAELFNSNPRDPKQIYFGNPQALRRQISDLEVELRSTCGGVAPGDPGDRPASPPEAPKSIKPTPPGNASPIAPPAYSGPAGPRKQRPFGGAGFKPY